MSDTSAMNQAFLNKYEQCALEPADAGRCLFQYMAKFKH
jgi:hypothetical protein